VDRLKHTKLKLYVPFCKVRDLLSYDTEEYIFRVLRIDTVVIIGSKRCEIAGGRQSCVTRRLTNLTLRQTSLDNIIRKNGMV